MLINAPKITGHRPSSAIPFYTSVIEFFSSLMVIMDDDERSPKDIRMAVHFKDEQCDEILSIYVTYFKNAAKYDEDGQSVEFDSNENAQRVLDYLYMFKLKLQDNQYKIVELIKRNGAEQFKTTMNTQSNMGLIPFNRVMESNYKNSTKFINQLNSSNPLRYDDTVTMDTLEVAINRIVTTYNSAQSAGALRNVRKTDEKVTVGGRERVVYKAGNKKYIKVNDRYTSLTDFKKATAAAAAAAAKKAKAKRNH